MRNGTRRLACPRDRRYQVGGSCRVRPGRKDPATCRCTHTRRYEPLARGAAQASKEHSRLLRWAPSPCPRRPCTPARRRRCRPDQRNAGQAACRNRRRRPHDPRTPLFPTVGHFASWAGASPGPQGISRSPPLRANPCRAAVAHRPAQRMRTRRRAHQRQPPRRALRPATRPARRTNSDRGRSATSCSSRASASSPTTSPTATSDPIGNASDTRSRSTAPDACSASSKRSATPSRSSKSTNQKPNKPLNPDHAVAAWLCPHGRIWGMGGGCRGVGRARLAVARLRGDAGGVLGAVSSSGDRGWWPGCARGNGWRRG